MPKVIGTSKEEKTTNDTLYIGLDLKDVGLDSKAAEDKAGVDLDSKTRARLDSKTGAGPGDSILDSDNPSYSDLGDGVIDKSVMPVPINDISGGRTLPEKTIEKLVTAAVDKPSECHFTKEQGAVCSPKNIVNKMAEFLKTKGITSIPKDPVKIVGNLKDMMNCNSESCIIKQPEFIKFAKIANINELLDNFFKPEGPATHFGLLSNFNIDDVLDQLQEKFQGFLHIPFQMRDFEKVGSELATIDLAEKFRSGIKSFGVVFNTDWSTGRGIHWYCIFGEKHPDKIVIDYFNSSGNAPQPEIQAWLQKTKHYLSKELKIPVEIKYSIGIKFQNDEHSCGVYCLMYIWLRLEGVPGNWFRKDNFGDALMHKARKALFRHEV